MIYRILIIRCHFASTSLYAKKENMYFHISLGGATVNYGGQAEKDINSLKSNGVFDESTSGSFSMALLWPAFYESMISGVSVTVISDKYTSNNFAGSGTLAEMEVKIGQIAWSNRYYFEKEPGKSFFVRGDLGIHRVNFSVENNVGNNLNSESKAGLSLYLGGGYSLPLNEDERVDFTLLFGKLADDQSEASFGSFMIGLMF